MRYSDLITLCDEWTNEHIEIFDSLYHLVAFNSKCNTMHIALFHDITHEEIARSENCKNFTKDQCEDWIRKTIDLYIWEEKKHGRISKSDI